MSRRGAVLVSVVVGLLVAAGPAAADHTNPREPLSPIESKPAPQAVTDGEGEWEYLFGLPPNPGTDLEIFKLRRRLYMSSGTLGGAPQGHVGQRLIRLLTKKKKVRPKWVADHGSSA
jgi:hypothetical protein